MACPDPTGPPTTRTSDTSEAVRATTPRLTPLEVEAGTEDESAVVLHSPIAPLPPATSKPGPRKKAVARPEEPGGVEDVRYGDTTTTVPTQLFRLDGLHQILNLKTWDERLSNGEREFLKQFLPDVTDLNDLLAAILDGHSNFFFGNPMQRLWDLMKQGECHPRVAKYREGLRCLHHCQHYHNVRDYHNNMVMALRQMVQEDDERNSLEERVLKWKAVFKERMQLVGREVKRQKRKG